MDKNRTYDRRNYSDILKLNKMLRRPCLSCQSSFILFTIHIKILFIIKMCSVNEKQKNELAKYSHVGSCNLFLGLELPPPCFRWFNS